MPCAVSVRKEVEFVVDAEEEGGICRFFQHLPSHDSEEGTALKDAGVKGVTYANLIADAYPSDKMPFFLIRLKSCTDIEPGDQVGFDYGIKYWIGHQQKPSYFSKATGLILADEHGTKKEKIQRPFFAPIGPACEPPPSSWRDEKNNTTGLWQLSP